ncbi:MAG TPA: DNA topoisomerase, partial [Candidatus Thermoplasmatota archaeon]|nr:DNA topoisomerase [Candidatus Thermoplasmatota archaeon]
HPPIHPTEPARASDLSAEQWKVYELVVRRFFATLSEPAVSEAMRVRFDLGGEEFQANGRRLVVPGFRKVYPYNKGEDITLPALAEGERIESRGVRTDSKFTKPPSRLSQGRLIQEMENLGLGTKSTRAEIISKLYNRDYVRGNPPEPTETGFAVTAALEEHAHLITKPDMTAQLEREMDEVAEAARRFEDVIDDSRRLLEQVMDELEANRQLVGGRIKQALALKNRIGTCTRCGEGHLTILKGRSGKRFVGCDRWPKCEQTYPLPQFGRITTLETNCPKCNAPGISIQNRGRPWITCLTMGCDGLKDWRPPKKGEAAAPEGTADAEKGGDEGEPVPAEAVDPEDL